MNNKFLDKVIEQIMSETRVIDGKLHTPFFSRPLLFLRPFVCLAFFSHCKDVYSLKNGQEVEYVWEKYKEEIVPIMDKKELTHQEKG